MLDDIHFQRRVAACSADLDRRLKVLATRYSPFVVIAAMSEHVGGALHLLQRDGICTPAEARAVLKRMERAAFGRTGGTGAPEAS